MIGHLNIGENIMVDIFMVVLLTTLARFLNISVSCLCSYVLDMFFNVLNYKLEPHSSCVTLEKQNSSLSAQDHQTASYMYFVPK